MSPSPAPHQGLTWSHVATLTVSLGFAMFLMYRGMEPYAAILHAIGAVAAIVFVILVPARIVEMIKQMKLVSQMAGTVDFGVAIANALRNMPPNGTAQGTLPPMAPGIAPSGEDSQGTS